MPLHPQMMKKVIFTSSIAGSEEDARGMLQNRQKAAALAVSDADSAATWNSQLSGKASTLQAAECHIVNGANIISSLSKVETPCSECANCT